MIKLNTVMKEKLRENLNRLFKKSIISFENPIFIWGMPRGGTTFLHDLLYLSSDLTSFNTKQKRLKKGIWGYLHYGENVPKKLINFYPPVEGFPRLWLNNNVYNDYKKNKICGKKKVLSELKKIQYDWFFKNNKKKRILEKSPNYSMILDIVEEIFPDAFHVCVLRDPRAVINSFARLIKFSAKDTTGKILNKGDPFLRFSGYKEKLNLSTYEILAWQMEQIFKKSLVFKRKNKPRFSYWYHEYIFTDLNHYFNKLSKKLDVKVSDNVNLIKHGIIKKQYPWWKNHSQKKKENKNYLSNKEINSLSNLDSFAIRLGYDKNTVGKLVTPHEI